MPFSKTLNDNSKSTKDTGQTPKSEKLSVVAWALIQNNIVTTPIFLIFTAIDFVMQLLLIVCIYRYFGALSFDTINLEKLIHLHGLGQANFIQEVIAFAYCLIIIASLLVLVLKQINPKFYTEKNFFLKALSLMLGLLRTFILTYFALILATNFLYVSPTNNTEDNSPEAFRYVAIFMLASTLLMLVALVYISAYLFNLTIPNFYLPWSQTGAQPYLLDALFKLMLSLAFNFRENGHALRYSFVAFSMLILAYKLLLRLRSCIMFNLLVYRACMIKDTIIMHVLFLCIPAEIFDDRNYYAYVLGVLPISLLGMGYLVQRFKIQWTVDQLENLKNDNQKIVAYLQILEFYYRYDHQRQIYLNQILYSHYQDCALFSLNLDKKLCKKVEKNLKKHLKEKQGDQEGNTETCLLIDPETLIDMGTINENQQYTNPQPSQSTPYFRAYKYPKTTEVLNYGSMGPIEEPIPPKPDSKVTQNDPNFERSNTNFERKVMFKTPNKKQSLGMIKRVQNNAMNMFNKSLNNSVSQLGVNRTMAYIKRMATGASDNSRPITAASSKDLITQQKQNDFINEKNDRITNQEERDKDIRKFMKHIAKHHLVSDSTKDYRLHLLKAYFTIKILKNSYLGHFLLFDLIQKSKADNIFTRNIKLLHQKSLDFLILSKNAKVSTEMLKIDLQTMMDINQMMGQFEVLLEVLTSDIYTFWSNLYQEREINGIFKQGLQISANLCDLQQLYEDLQLKQGEKKEIKIFAQMAAFNKYVIFKNQEYINEMQKYKQQYQTRQIANEKYGGSSQNEKGLLIVDLELKKPMKVGFINKPACHLIQYDKTQAEGMRINEMMPELIAENHYKFIENFMQTGKGGVLNKKRMLMLKKKNGYITPVNTYLFINHIVFKSMILLLDDLSEELKPFGDGEDCGYGIILADSQLRIHEISKECAHLCRISYGLLDLYRQVYNRNPYIEDLFHNESTDMDFQTSISQGYSEIDVSIKYQELLEKRAEYFNEFKQQDDIDEVPQDFSSLRKISRARPLLVSQRSMMLQFNSFQQSQFTLKFTSDFYLNNQIEIKIIYIKLSQQAMASNVMGVMPNLVYGRDGSGDGGERRQTVEPNSAIVNLQSAKNDQVLSGHIKGVEFTNSGDQQLDFSEDLFDVSSQSSNSTSISTLISKFSIETNNVDGKKTPSTLKFVLQIVLLVFFLIIATSTVSLILIQSNFKDAIKGIQVSNLSITRLNKISQMRLLMRVLVNIAETYNDNNNTVLPDRCAFYTDMLEDLLEELRLSQLEIDIKDTENVQAKVGNVILEVMTAQASFFFHERSISQAVNLYITYGNDLINIVKKAKTCDALFSWLVYFWIPILNIYEANVKEREMYFIIQNGNQDLFFKLYEFALLYVKLNEEKIQSKVNFSTTMTWICIGIILISSIIIIPLFGKIQNRVMMLMSVFFNIEKEAKKEIVEKINKFKDIVNMNKIPIHNVAFNSEIMNTPILKGLKKHGQDDDQHDDIQNDNDKSNLDLQKSHLNIMAEESKEQDFFEDENSDNQKGHSKHKGRKSILNKKRFRKEDPTGSESVSQSQASESNEKDKRRRRKKKGKGVQDEINMLDQSSQIAKTFAKGIQKKKLFQSLLITFLMCAFQSYFIGTYFLSDQSFDEMAKSIDSLFILFQRKACGEDVIHAIVEGYQWNDTYLVNHGRVEIMDYFTKFCFKLETDYQQKIRKERPEFLSGAIDYLEMLESGDFCDQVFSDGDGFKQLTVTPDKCKKFAGGITNLGITNIFQTTYKVCQQLQIEYQRAFDEGGDRTGAFIYPRLKAASVYLDVIETILTKPMNILRRKTLQSMEDHFNKASLNFIIIYAAFLFLVFTIMFIFFYSIFTRLRKEMILSNKLLYIIDFGQLSDVERIKITKFLTSY